MGGRGLCLGSEKKPKARKTLENVADSHTSATRFDSLRLMLRVYRRINIIRNQSSCFVAKAISAENN
jgi:hypothetical protein